MSNLVSWKLFLLFSWVTAKANISKCFQPSLQTTFGPFSRVLISSFFICVKKINLRPKILRFTFLNKTFLAKAQCYILYFSTIVTDAFNQSNISFSCCQFMRSKFQTNVKKHKKIYLIKQPKLDLPE